MKKIVFIATLFLLVILTGSNTLAYWHGGEISFPPLSRIQISDIKIGSWDYDKENNNIANNPNIGDNLIKGKIVSIDGRYYYIYNDFTNIGINSSHSSWTNYFKSYGGHYSKGVFYEKDSFVIKDGHIFKANDQSASDKAPEVGMKEKSEPWEDLGSIELLTWKEGLILKEGDHVYWEGKIYLRNNRKDGFVDIIPPGSGPGYNLYNELDFDEYTVYKEYTWRGLDQNPIVLYNNRIYTLIANTNIVDDKLVLPGDDSRIWQLGFVTNE